MMVVVRRPTVRRRLSSVASAQIKHLVLLFLVAFVMLPIVVLFLNSLRSFQDIMQAPIAWPASFNLENYPGAWRTADFTIAFRNNLVILALTVPVVCAIASFSAYALARLRPPGTDVITTYYLLGFTIPAQLYIVPLFIIWVNLSLTNNLFGVAIVYWAIFQPFSIFLLRAYYLGLPLELEDAARVDGCSEFRVLTAIVLPLSTPIITTLAVIISVWTWNEFLHATMLISKPDLRTVTLSFVAFTAEFETDFAEQSAAGILTAIPVVALFLALQRRFIQGIAHGGLRF